MLIVSLLPLVPRYRHHDRIPIAAIIKMILAQNAFEELVSLLTEFSTETAVP